MSFLSGIFLMAIPLVGLPVILHFYKRQQRDVVHWGAMQFLTDAAIEGRRFERIEELVLMLLRALAVAALVFAMAQPLVQNSWIGASTEQDVILILDDSMSMARAVDGESSFDKMQEHVAKLLGDLTDKDSVQIMLASGGGRWLTSAPAPGNARSTNELQATIADLNPTLGATDLFSCLQWAIDTEPTTAARSRRVVVFTDSQVFGWHVDASGPWQQLRESCQTAGSDEQSFVPTSIQVVDCSSQESSLDNLAVVRLEASRTLTGSGDPVTFTVELKNVGKTASQSTTLKWFVDGNRISDSSIPSLEAGESVHRTWSHSFNDEGVFSVECSFDNDDQLSLDNESSMVVEVVNKIPFLVVDEPTSGDSDFAAARLFTATLGYENDKPMGDWQSVFEPHVIGYDELSDIAMAKYRAAVIADAPQIPTDVVDRLRSFVERGGGLWIALGKRTDRDAFNASWFDEGDGLSPLKLAKPVGHGRVTDAEFDIHPPSGDHVVTKNIADTKRLDIDEVKISRHHSFVLGKGDTDVSVLLETGVGAPLVIENYVGDGRVVIQAMPLDLQWSNMPLTNAYVVMVHDFLAYLTQPAATRFNLQPGGEISFATSEELADAKSTIETPTGDAIDITPDDRGDAALCRFAGTYLPGDYRLKFVHGDEVLSEFPFHVSRENEESDLRRLSSGQQSWLADNGGIEFAKTADVSSVETDQLPSSRPVWWLLLVTLLIVMVCELALATQSARRRYAPVV